MRIAYQILGGLMIGGPIAYGLFRALGSREGRETLANMGKGALVGLWFVLALALIVTGGFQ